MEKTRQKNRLADKRLKECLENGWTLQLLANLYSESRKQLEQRISNFEFQPVKKGEDYFCT